MELWEKFGLLPFSRSEALANGLPAWRWDTLVREKKLIKMRRGVYVCGLATEDRTKHAQRASAALNGRTGHVACSGSAAALLGLPNPYFTPWARVPVTTAGPRSIPSSAVRLRQDWDVVETPWGFCTDLVSTAEVMAAELPLPQALMVIDRIARDLAGTEDRFALASADCRVEVRRRLTSRLALDALRLANPAAESPAESYYRGLMISRGLPEPLVGVPVLGASGRQYFVDMLLGNLIIEVDGRVKYVDLSVLTDEKRREDDLRLTGRDFLRSWVEDLYADHEAEMRTVVRVISQSYPQAYPHLGITTQM